MRSDKFAEQLTAINARYYAELKRAHKIHHLHTVRQEMISIARDHRAYALKEITGIDLRRVGLRGLML